MIRLEKVSSSNVWELLSLSVYDNQQKFVATNTQSIIEAYTTIIEGGVALPFGIYDGKTPIGFLMIGYGSETLEGAAEPASKPSYSIWRFMIDRKWQGKGYGRQAFQLALDFVKTKPCGEANGCYLSYEPENEVAKRLYSSFGFVETGEKDEDEVVSRLVF